MNPRILEGPVFAFSEAQQKNLMKFLPGPAAGAKVFLRQIETPLTLFILTRQSHDKLPVPTQAQVKARLQRIRGATESLRQALECADPDEEYYPLVEAVGWVLSQAKELPDFSGLDGEEWIQARLNHEAAFEGRAEVLLEELVAHLKVLGQALEWELTHFRNAPRGRPYGTWEIMLLEDIARCYLACYGRTPSDSKESRFHKFIVLALGYAGFPQKSWFRTLHQAVGRLKAQSPGEEAH